jgi:hypothetical protein
MKIQMIILVTLVFMLLISACSAQMDIQSAMNNVARSCPSVGNTVTVVDNSHIGVTISPGPYATSSDLTNAVATLIIAYSEVLKAAPSYQGYLRIGIANKGPDGKNHIVQIFEAPAWETRANQNQMASYVNSILGRGKEQMYQYMVDGYLVKWPGPDPYDLFGTRRDPALGM